MKDRAAVYVGSALTVHNKLMGRFYLSTRSR